MLILNFKAIGIKNIEFFPRCHLQVKLQNLAPRAAQKSRRETDRRDAQKKRRMEKDEKSSDTANITIKFSGQSIPISLSLESTIRDLKSLLQPLTNVLPRGQKLIFKGRILDDHVTLRSSGVSDRAKIMLVASQGLHQGDGPISRLANANRGKKNEKSVAVGKSHFERWKSTGVFALSGCNLTAIPDELWTCGPYARVLDLSHNSLQDVPASIGLLCYLERLLLNANEILDDFISWEGLTSLKSLTVLSLSQNHLKSLPSALGSLSCLRELDVANNNITCLPTEIGCLTQLQVLKANNNRLYNVPASIGECTALLEVDLMANLLVELPETFGNLQNLKALYLSNNGLKALPPTLFKMCTQLSTLDLHGTQITMDMLRQCFDSLKVGKILIHVGA
ncbi:LRR repeats and ubiquitin-like domain-containing protein At2g30105 isoform X2 [Diospyros lotus]|uniref:LRR repeats and ubiquitin-like domain-containing protein At2g30105 isoform X2 n=1 Tax=Diospyros lotus TaxID=55363 RepID=UPI00224D438E|nr:LRR repeats and ubiquitin-like domain-containing protein At2g30105 isoform X2 [Diospyros lotus]